MKNKLGEDATDRRFRCRAGGCVRYGKVRANGHFRDNLTRLCAKCYREANGRTGGNVIARNAEALSKLPYPEYLQTDHWKRIRAWALRQAGYRCQICHTKKTLHTHHRTYERLGSERLSDLTVLCRACHERHHGISGLTRWRFQGLCWGDEG